jgi:hypothetical protein
MAGSYEAYENLAAYPVDDSKREQLFKNQLECAVVWSSSQGWPVGVMHWFVWRDGAFWVTATYARKRVKALRRRPQSCVIVSTAGTDLGPATSVTAKTMASVHDDPSTKEWFFGELARKAHGRDTEDARAFEEMLHNTGRVVIQLDPVQYISYDALKMYRAVQESGLNTHAEGTDLA